MSECHKCQVSMEIANGVYRGTPWEKMPCAKCKLSDEPNHRGCSHVSRDAETDAVENIEIRQALEHSDEGFSGQEYFRRDALRHGLRQLLHLFQENAQTAEIVLFRICNPTKKLKIIADRQGITVQAVHSRLKRAREKWPELAAIIPMRSWSWNPANKESEGGDGQATS